jgi:hypothetical protein
MSAASIGSFEPIIRRSKTANAMQHEIRTYAELREQMHDALREQHPDWIEPNGDCPTCHIYERRFAELLALFAKTAVNREAFLRPTGLVLHRVTGFRPEKGSVNKS